ncbi:hypothetical protein MUK42_28242 [Musa troglodytarum]|uniref:Uncharacterized protein n=1 Tax=Musa troglodytarum TaxID=320322 RepID=A0A9E7FPW5_9LILI|nr:hypothetical protein MUK42_28242 [Musa troglodytarum]
MEEKDLIPRGSCRRGTRSGAGSAASSCLPQSSRSLGADWSSATAAAAVLRRVAGSLSRGAGDANPLRAPNGNADLTLLSCRVLIAANTSSTPTGDNGGEPSVGGDRSASVDVGEENMFTPLLPGDVGLGGRTMRSCSGE